jgi:hypothetical protein
LVELRVEGCALIVSGCGILQADQLAEQQAAKRRKLH